MRLVEAAVEVVVIGWCYAHPVLFRCMSTIRVFFFLRAFLRPVLCQFLEGLHDLCVLFLGVSLRSALSLRTLSSDAFSVLSFQHFDVVHYIFKVVLSVFSQKPCPKNEWNLSLRVDEVLPENYLTFWIDYVPFFINQVALLIAPAALVINKPALGVFPEHGEATWISLEISLNAVNIELHEGENLGDLVVLTQSMLLKEDLAFLVNHIAFLIH